MNSQYPLLPRERVIREMSDIECEAMWRRLRWAPHGEPLCPKCARGDRIYHAAAKSRRSGNSSITWCCGHCRRDFSATSGTVFSYHKVSLRTVLLAISLVQHNAGDGVIRRIYKDLGVTYKSAYCFLGRAREMRSPARARDLEVRLAGISRSPEGHRVRITSESLRALLIQLNAVPGRIRYELGKARFRVARARWHADRGDRPSIAPLKERR